MKRTLAAPIVVTFLAACAPAEPEAVVPKNPPQPDVLVPPVPPGPAEPEPIEVADPAPLPRAPFGTPGELKRDKGLCYWQERVVMRCEPDKKCYQPVELPPIPPDPYQVECPVEDPSLPDAPAGVTVQTRNDGSCFYYVRRDTGACRPGRTCNPPPPRQVDVKCAPNQTGPMAPVF